MEREVEEGLEEGISDAGTFIGKSRIEGGLWRVS